MLDLIFYYHPIIKFIFIFILQLLPKRTRFFSPVIDSMFHLIYPFLHLRPADSFILDTPSDIVGLNRQIFEMALKISMIYSKTTSKQ